MAYGSRHNRRRPRRTRRRRSYRKRRVRRRKMPFKKTSRAIRRAGALACPVVYECLKKIADHNQIYSLKDCEGAVRSSRDNFTASEPHLAIAGPFSAGTGEAMEPCGYLGFNVYADPNVVPHAGAMVTDMHPANIEYAGIPLEYQVFPLLAQTNPTITDSAFNENNCRVTSRANIISFDNRHSYRITWPEVINDAANAVGDLIWNMTLTSYEIVWWVPDLSTVEDNKLVSIVVDTDTHEETQIDIRIRNKWLRQMFNAYICTHPVPDSTIVDVTDMSGTTSGNFDQYNEPTAIGIRVDDDNMLPRSRDPKQFLADGIHDRRKDARKLWMRKKVHKRPKRRNRVGNSRFIVTDAQGMNLASTQSRHRAGRVFHINKNMEWDRQTADSTPDTTVRDVCPRGVYVYCKYWYFRTLAASTVAEDNILAPSVTTTFTGAVDKTHVLKWQNM